MSRLQLLTTKFEDLKMNDDEIIVDFNVRLLDIANELPQERKTVKKDLLGKCLGPYLRDLI